MSKQIHSFSFKKIKENGTSKKIPKMSNQLAMKSGESTHLQGIGKATFFWNLNIIDHFIYQVNFETFLDEVVP